MVDNGDIFPEASLSAILNKIRAPARNFPSMRFYAVDLLKKLDTNNDEFIDYREFSDGLRNMGVMVTPHESHALMRYFDTNGDGKISMEEFYNGLSKE